jgi:hypothetical protein
MRDKGIGRQGAELDDVLRINEAAKYVEAACWNEDDLNVRFGDLNLKIRGTWMLQQSKVPQPRTYGRRSFFSNHNVDKKDSVECPAHGSACMISLERRISPLLGAPHLVHNLSKVILAFGRWSVTPLMKAGDMSIQAATTTVDAAARPS